MFTFSRSSKERLKYVDPKLSQLAHRALSISRVDFGVTEGLRSEERQKKLVQDGLSQTMNSKHIEAKAIDIVPSVNGTISWDIGLFFPVADAFIIASRELNTPIRWGGAWHCTATTSFVSAAELHLEYMILRLGARQTPFIDAPHFELV